MTKKPARTRARILKAFSSELGLFPPGFVSSGSELGLFPPGFVASSVAHQSARPPCSSPGEKILRSRSEFYNSLIDGRSTTTSAVTGTTRALASVATPTTILPVLMMTLLPLGM